MSVFELKIGVGATVSVGSDRIPCTVIKISKNKFKLVLQQDKYIRLDNNNMSDSQEYAYETDLNGTLYHAYKDKNENYYCKEFNSIVILGLRRRFYDYSF